MRIVGWQGNEISNLVDWANLFSTSQKGRQWKEGRSAYSLADFIMIRGGAAHLESRISLILSQQVNLETATPEYRAKFDSFRGNPSNLDLGINGYVDSGASLFVGVEAKVDEKFGDTVGKTHGDGIRKRKTGKRTNAPERVEGLISRYASEPGGDLLSWWSHVRYQLLTGTAGTVCAGKGVSVFYVLVFKTRCYDEQKGKDNQRDYEEFINCAGNRLVAPTPDAVLAHEITLDGKRLTCIYDYVDILNGQGGL